MKNNIILIIGMFLAVALGSCTRQVLDTQPFDRVGEDVIWSSKANAETFIYSTYASVMSSYASGTTPKSDPFTTNILSYDGPYNYASPVFTGTIDRNADMGFNNWEQIRRCNLIINKVQASSAISDDDKKTLAAEGKFLRAMSYFVVARNIGRIVWVDSVLTPDDDLLLPSTANPTETYHYIIKDLEDAVQGLSADKVPGRANKYVAAAMLSEVCLEALAYKNYPNAAGISPSDPLIQKAIDNAKLVIEQGGYSLEQDYGSMFNEINPTSPEIIMAIYRKAINTACNQTYMQLMMPNFSNDAIKQYGGSPFLKSSVHIFEAWSQFFPGQNLADEYLVTDKNNPSLALPWDQTSQFKNAVNEGSAVPVSKIPQAGGEVSIEHGAIKPGNSETMWTLTNEGRDARWQASVVSDSTQLYGETLTTCIDGNATRWMRTNGAAYYVSTSNMYWRKGMYNNVNPRVYVGIPTDYHWVITRLGRIYLNLAEAYLLKGDVPDAVAAYNETRTVHGKLPPSTATTLAGAWTDYKRERRVDLTLENDYYWSLLRWGRYGGAANHGLAPGGTIPELTEAPYVMDISKDRKYFSIVEGSFIGSNNIRVFNPRRYLFPIAQSYLDRNPKFGPQNPGW